MRGEHTLPIRLDVTITDPEEVRRAADLFAIIFALVVFARGVHAHVGFAVFMSIFLSLWARVLLRVLIDWNVKGRAEIAGFRVL